MTLENIIRSEAKYVSVLSGTLRDSVVDAAVALWPELTRYQERRRLVQPSREFDRRDQASEKATYLPRWRRSDTHGEQGQSLAEYALLIALIAIVAIVAVLFLGSAISGMLQGIGESI